MTKEIEDRLKTALFARRIPFNVYSFKNNSVVVISTVRGARVSINMAHTISKISNTEYEVSEFSKTLICRNVNEAISRVVSMIRRNEMTFAKYTKK